MDTIGNFFDKIILHINSYILPLKIDKISKFCLKLLSSVKKKSGDLVIFFWPEYRNFKGEL